MKSLLKLLMIFTVGLFQAPFVNAQETGNTPLMLDIIDGETSFIVIPGLNTAYWVLGECRRDIPMKPQTKNNSASALMSRKLSDKVTLGREQVVLEQQFKFNLTDTPVNVEVFNSVRGGWTIIPVRLNQQCRLDASCLARMELPIC
ncbi:hypothetical protein [Robiginitomaculum antarcticum]|uniref:hypothetical protein n=1 Tax=Robiginitomaculum antarcticum TaxID=437507 RepID=UPI0012EA56FB|nr:hypothetical protein [Robiginitomaculum antarcticum]